MFKRLAMFIILSLIISGVSHAASIDSQFNDSDAMFNHARGLLFDYDGETASNLVKIARDNLAELNNIQNERDRIDAAMDAWFAAVYADMRNNSPYPPKDENLQKKIDSCLAAAGKALGVSGKDPKYIKAAQDYLNGKLPDHCGINKGVTPVTGDINMIILDNGIGRTRTMYYHQLKNENGAPDCGELRGAICYRILSEMPVTPVLRESGVQGDSMTFITECVSPE